MGGALAIAASLLVGVGVQVAAGGIADAATGARVLRWIDGDTVETSQGTVRLIGIDTPERGACGSTAATRHASSIAPVGSRVLLGNPASVVDRDRYGRLLRYVDTPDGRDVGLAQVRDGARARYDSRDGYQWHRREARYHRADARHRDFACGGTATGAAGGTSGTGATSGTGGTATPVDGECPASAPIKGNADSMIYHRPDQRYYDITEAEECFATAAAAEAAGYRAAMV